MRTSVAVLATVALATFLFGSGTIAAKRQCKQHLDKYLRCEAAVREAPDLSDLNEKRLHDQLKLCFERNGCQFIESAEEMPASETKHVPQKCIDDLIRKLNVAQSDCISNHFPEGRSLLNSLTMSDDLTVTMKRDHKGAQMTLDRIVDDSLEEVHLEKALASFVMLHGAGNLSKCSDAQRARTIQCVKSTFQALHQRTKSMDAYSRVLQAEKWFDQFCAGHRACFRLLPATCVPDLVEKEKKFCNCLLSRLHGATVAEFSRCSGTEGVAFDGPPICDRMTGISFCRHTFIDAMTPLSSYDEQEDETRCTNATSASASATAEAFVRRRKRHVVSGPHQHSRGQHHTGYN